MTNASAANEDARAPVVLAVAPNGAHKTPQHHPQLPVTRDALVACAVACRDEGASMLHLHVRDADGRHLLDASAYRDTTAALCGRPLASADDVRRLFGR